MPMEQIEARLRTTIEAYERSPDLYADRYLSVDFEAIRSDFLGALANSAGPILDAGAGPGRDSAHFARTEHPTVAVDLSGLGRNTVVRCRKGHLFTTIWTPGVSFKAVRLGLTRAQWCPVGRHFSLVRPVDTSELTDQQKRQAAENHDIRIP